MRSLALLQSVTAYNFVVLFVDDMGYGDLDVLGAPTTSTPHIRRMASEGTVLTQWYSAHAICTPSRAAMVTGRLPIRNGLCGSGPNGNQGVFSCSASKGLPTNETTFATALGKHGYATMMLGKWHLGQKMEYMPHNHGFQEYFGVPYSVDMGQAYNNASAEADFEGGYYGCNPLPIVENTTIIEQPCNLGTLNARYTEKAVGFITRNQDSPFLLYLAYGHVHTPQFAAKAMAGQSLRGVFGDSVEELDKSVGTILDAIRSFDGTKSKTLVLFTSDNGAPDAYQHNPEWQPFSLAPHGSNGPFLGGKTSTWEGGLREPGIAWMPGTVKVQRWQESSVSTLDVFATIMDLAGVPMPTDRVMDSVSMLPILTGKPSTQAVAMQTQTNVTASASASASASSGASAGGSGRRTTHFFYQGCTIYAVRHGSYKLHYVTTAPQEVNPRATHAPYGKQNPPLVFQIEHDPGEKYALSSKSAEFRQVVTDVAALVAQHQQELGTPPAPVLGDTDASSKLCCDPAKSCSCTPPPEGMKVQVAVEVDT